MSEIKAPWEVKEIDLNLRHYSGKASDVIKRIKFAIECYLSNPTVPDETRKIYSAIYNALNYYKNISCIPSPDFSTTDAFLTNSIDNFNNDYEYLTSKYDSPDPTAPPVISLSCRIKSPLGFVEKVKDKISEYIEKGRNLRYFNESLRDLMGIRIVIDPPQEIKDQGLQAESDFLYQVFYDLMSKHGLNRQGKKETELEGYRFIPINTRHSPNKLASIKSRPNDLGFSEKIDLSSENAENFIFIPKQRIPEVEQPHVDAILKDYNMWPKYSGYQSLHVCVIPDYSDYVEESILPPYIIPPAVREYSMEYQIRTKKQDDYAEHGHASHKFSYKPHEVLYHRMAVPSYIDFDKPEEMEFIPKSKKTAKKLLKLRNFAESYKRFYGHSFKDRFNITFKELHDIFSSPERDAVLADQLRVAYDETRDLYYLEKVATELTLDSKSQSFLQSLLGVQANAGIEEFFDLYGVTDGINSDRNTEANTTQITQKSLQIYMIDDAEKTQNKNLQHSKLPPEKEVTDTNQEPEK